MLSVAILQHGGGDWELYGNAQENIHYYDKESITRTSDNHVRVWAKILYSEKSILELVTKFGKEYVNVSHNLYLSEIDCTNKKRRFFTLIYYSKDGGVIYSVNEPNAEWSFITPDSIGESLYKKVCK